MHRKLCSCKIVVWYAWCRFHLKCFSKFIFHVCCYYLLLLSSRIIHFCFRGVCWYFLLPQKITRPVCLDFSNAVFCLPPELDRLLVGCAQNESTCTFDTQRTDLNFPFSVSRRLNLSQQLLEKREKKKKK